MPISELKYGLDPIQFDYDESRFDVIDLPCEKAALTDAEIGEKLDGPTDAGQIEDIVRPGDTVLIVVPDATRQTACGQIVNLVVRRLIASGAAAHDIRIIFATGIHRKVTEQEKAVVLTPFIAQRIKTLDHDPRDLSQLIRFGETLGGVPIELNRALVEHDHVIIIGGAAFHYFAGFTGGRKLICPGLASARTISGTHKLAFDCESMSRRRGVGTGLLDGNAVHEAFQEIVKKIEPAFSITSITNTIGNAVDVFCGNWITSHRAACDAYAADHTFEIEEKRDLVIVSCGGYPFDINLIQAHKALDAASMACREGGTIVLLAECSDGIGRDDFLKWFAAPDSAALGVMLCEKYQVNGQTAWSLLRKAERFNIKMVSRIDDAELARMRIGSANLQDLAALARDRQRKGYILPNGAKLRVKCKAMA